MGAFLYFYYGNDIAVGTKKSPEGTAEYRQGCSAAEPLYTSDQYNQAPKVAAEHILSFCHPFGVLMSHHNLQGFRYATPLPVFCQPLLSPLRDSDRWFRLLCQLLYHCHFLCRDGVSSQKLRKNERKDKKRQINLCVL